MSGRKQHFIQQLLLKGFSYDFPKKPCHVWVYRREAKPFPTATEGYGAERDFYSDPSDTALDDDITELEVKRFNAFLASLREGDDRWINPRDASDFAIHAMARAKNIRSMLTEGIARITAHAKPLLFDENVRYKAALSELRRNPALVLGKLDLQLQSPSQRRRILKRVDRELPKLTRQWLRKKVGAVDQMMAQFVHRIAELVADGHRRMLLGKLNNFSGGRVDQYLGLSWYRLTVASPLILGDSVQFAELSDGSFKPASEPGDQLKHIVLPVSSSLALVGSTLREKPATPDARLREGAATCSYDSFCAASGPLEHESLIALIRTRTFSLSDDDAKRMAEKAINEFIR